MPEQQIGQPGLERDVRITAAEQHQDRVRVRRLANERGRRDAFALGSASHGSPLPRSKPDALHPHGSHVRADHRPCHKKPVTSVSSFSEPAGQMYAVSEVRSAHLYPESEVQKLVHPSRTGGKRPLLAGISFRGLLERCHFVYNGLHSVRAGRS